MRYLISNFLIVSFFALFFNAYTVADEQLLKFKKISVNVSQDYKKIGEYSGNIENLKYKNIFYADDDGQKLKGYIEFFEFDNEGNFLSRFYDWSKSVIFKADPSGGCNESDDDLFFRSKDNGVKLITCLKVKIINASELSGPDFGSVQQVNMKRRKFITDRYIKKARLEIPDQMLRSEHYLYKDGKLTYVFFSQPVDNYNDQIFKDYLINTILRHENFEKQFNYNSNEILSFADLNFDKKFKKPKDTVKKVVKLKKDTVNEKQIDDNLNVKKQKNWLTSILENSYKLNPSNCTLDPSGKKVDEIKNLSDVWDPKLDN